MTLPISRIYFNFPFRPLPSLLSTQNVRHFATELNPSDYDFMTTSAFDSKKGLGPSIDYNPEGKFFRWVEERIRYKDRYQAKIYVRVMESTREFPNLVYSEDGREKVIGCLCERDSMHFNYWILKNDGMPRRCECGVWYKITDAVPENL